MKESNFKLKVKFLEPVLGSQPTVAVASEFLAKRAGFETLPEDEIETLPEVLERGTTVFNKDRKGRPLVTDYQVKGFLKNSGKIQNGRIIGGIKALRSKVNDYLFVTPRFISLNVPDGEEVSYLERPLRAETAQGPRVALARSEMLPAGTWFECGITSLDEVINEDALRELLDYGYWQGMGQWRNGGFGKFTYELVRED